jgi:penicillin G amidase
MRIVLRSVAIVVVAVVILVALYAGNIFVGMRSTATVNGTIAATGITAPTLILRDARGVPHIRAANEHDAFFAEGYVVAQDRLFQLDLLRRFVYGQLSEVLGNAVVA